jgi:hypothetical protein
VGFLSTKIRPLKNEELHVPNTVIIGTTRKNDSRLGEGSGASSHTSLSIDYDTARGRFMRC